MRTTKINLIAALLISFCIVVFAQKKDTTLSQSRVQELEERVSEIRRDQLNYRIEKDLLKETFSSNYQTINIVLAITLGVFSVIGFLGMRDIGSIKKEYSVELERLNTLRRDLEEKVKRIGEEQEKTKDQYLEMINVNENQNRRIKVLELQEKISSLMHDFNYVRALEYAAIALELDKDNTVLLTLKAACLWHTNQLQAAALTYDQLLALDPTNQSIIMNLLELYLIQGRMDEFGKLYQSNRTYIENISNGNLKVYFDILKAYQLNDEAAVVNVYSSFIEKYPTERTKMIEWQFTEANQFLSSKPDSKAKKIIKTFVSLVSGEIDKAEAQKAIQ